MGGGSSRGTWLTMLAYMRLEHTDWNVKKQNSKRLVCSNSPRLHVLGNMGILCFSPFGFKGLSSNQDCSHQSVLLELQGCHSWNDSVFFFKYRSIYIFLFLVKSSLQHELVLGLLLEEPHLVAASVRLQRRVVTAAEVLLALEGGRLAKGARQTQGLRSVLALARKAPKLPKPKTDNAPGLSVTGFKVWSFVFDRKSRSFGSQLGHPGNNCSTEIWT